MAKKHKNEVEYEKHSSLLREAFSENGIGSSKRMLGALIITVCMGCIIYFVVTEGATEHVTQLLDTAMLVACGLLGLGSIASVWKYKYAGNKVSMPQYEKEGEGEENEENELDA